jgi:pimeloyl-ACP methyl ester carboxylesterase
MTRSKDSTMTTREPRSAVSRGAAATVGNAALAMPAAVDTRGVRYGALAVDGLSISYREAGRPGNPKLVLLHGFPSSSHQYRNLAPALADRFHVIAPDYPGFGLSDRPGPAVWSYTFERISTVIERFLDLKGFDHFGLYVQDYGGPVGFRMLSRRPEALEWLVIQNSNAYEVGFTAAWDGLRGALWKNRSEETEAPLHAFLSPETIRGIYLHGARRPELISPDAWESDAAFLQRPHAVRLNLDLFYDYRTNVPLYPEWQRFLRERRPRTQIFWGQEDLFFTPAGGEAYLADVPDAEMHRLDAGHFATEDHLEYIADRMRRFYDNR